jgi:protein required for attachment to host cells
MKVMKNWLVVANSARARVLEDGEGAYAHVADLVHPASRQKGIELGDDRPGHAASDGRGGVQLEPRTELHEREHERFAREVATVINAGVADGRCAGLVLVASNPFLGLLKAQLSEPARRLVLRKVASDFTACSDAELAQRLGPV